MECPELRHMSFLKWYQQPLRFRGLGVYILLKTICGSKQTGCLNSQACKVDLLHTNSPKNDMTSEWNDKQDTCQLRRRHGKTKMLIKNCWHQDNLLVQGISVFNLRQLLRQDLEVCQAPLLHPWKKRGTLHLACRPFPPHMQGRYATKNKPQTSRSAKWSNFMPMGATQLCRRFLKLFPDVRFQTLRNMLVYPLTLML